jgi:hypothetical protein
MPFSDSASGAGELLAAAGGVAAVGATLGFAAVVAADVAALALRVWAVALPAVELTARHVLTARARDERAQRERKVG